MHGARFETPLVFLAAKRKQAENIPDKIPAQVRLDTHIFKSESYRQPTFN